MRYKPLLTTLLAAAIGGTALTAVQAPTASAATGPIFTVMNTSETPPDGVWFRNSPHTADTDRVTGHGVYMNEQVQLQCYAWGDAVGAYSNTLWYYSLNVTRPTNAGVSNEGYLNAHYINDGLAANQIDAGVAACDSAPPPPPPPVSRTYVALGDSYSSGEGNPPFDAGTATSSDKCHRSSAAWPRVLAAATAHNITHVACSGATVGELSSGRYGEVGQYASLAGVASAGQVNLVTVTIGGNDLGFSTILGSCRFYPRCLSNLPSNMATVDQIASQLETQVLPMIRQSAPGARVVLVGYPRLFPTSQSSTVNCGWLTNTKRKNLNTLAGYIDSKYLVAASRAGASYVSTLDVLQGHELCTRNSWVTPITSSGTNWLTNANQGHPTPSGQNAMEARVQSALGL